LGRRKREQKVSIILPEALSGKFLLKKKTYNPISEREAHSSKTHVVEERVFWKKALPLLS